ncbi:MAG TPA: PLP-dependent lyase/thiolase, partial [Actinomycetota bacterium]|nr:PLP-dependent lyase/thiolase [Actinomycetota bacterium]
MTGGPATMVVCSGCGQRATGADPFPFRCPSAGTDDVDHVMVRELDPTHVSFPDNDDPNPFVRYRELFHAYHLGHQNGMSDADHVHLVEQLDKAVAAVDGRGFAVTPFERSEALSEAVGCSVWVKDETGNVSGSHKARHLMGLMIHLLVAEQTGLAPPDGRELAIASCGNAALAAAVVARAAERPIRVFVPTWADEAIVRRLRDLGATIEVCEREVGLPGDPTYHALRRAIDAGAIPFTCQGPDNGLTIEGGQTLGYELVSQLAHDGESLDRLIVQVGGGALASACVRAFEDAALLEAPERLPKVHAVQTRNAHPLERAFMRVRQRAGYEADPESIVEAMAWARTHRSEVMWPWEEEPRSVAEGILDDETYDWAAVVGGMLATDAAPVLVSEDRLREANVLARDATGIPVSHTGSAGLAGLLELASRGELRPDERVAVLFTGIERDEEGEEHRG